MTADRRRVGLAAIVGLATVSAVALAAGVAAPARRPARVEHAAPKRPSLHAAPADDVAALNAAFARRVPAALAADLLPDARPGVVFFFKADCACSRGFAGWASALAAHLDESAACTAVIEGSDADASHFATASGLVIPFIAESGSGLARAWGVRKAGAFALVEPDGSVAAVWPGISRQGFRDLADRLGVAPPLPDDLLAAVPGAATAGCALHSAE
jgi:hypothetical protein